MNLFRWITPQFVSVLALFLAIIAPYVVWAQGPQKRPLVAELNSTTVRLYETPCTVPEILAQIDESYHSKWQRGHAKFSDHERRLCWAVTQTPDGSHVVLIADEQGQRGMVPIELFKPETDA